MLADFHLLRPFWLLALIPVLVCWWLFKKHRQDLSPWQQLIASHLQPAVLISQHVQRRQPWALPLLACCWLLTVLALSGPTWQKLPQPALSVKKATVLLMDMSMSMRATDMTPDRLTQQRFKAMDFVDLLKEGDLALISYAGAAFVVSPLTPDHNNIRLQIPNLRPELMPEQGSDILHALQLATSLLQQAGYPEGEVVLFTDGFEQDSYHQIQQLLNTWPYRLSILAFGQADGAVVRLENGELLKNHQGGVVIPKVPLEQLQILARQGGGVFQQASSDNHDLRALLDDKRDWSGERQAQTNLTGDQWRDNAIYLVWLLLPLALWLGRRAPVLLIVPFMYLPSADAMSWRDLWQTQQQQAIDDYQQQDYQSARNKFNDPFWQGNAAYREGDYAGAANAYQQAVTKAPSTENWHNLGNALAMQQQYQQALEAYEQAAKLSGDNTQAAKNAELMRQLLQQQEKENEQSQQGEQGEQQDKQQSKSDSEQTQSDEQQSAEEQSAQSDNQSQNNAPEEQQGKEDQADAEPQPEPTAQESADEKANEQQKPASIVEQTWPNATPEQQQELENLLRKVQDDPGLLLRNRMLLEHQKRRMQQPPQGARQEW